MISEKLLEIVKFKQTNISNKCSVQVSGQFLISGIIVTWYCMAAVRYCRELRNINDFSSQSSEGPRENQLIHSVFKDVNFFFM